MTEDAYYEKRFCAERYDSLCLSILKASGHTTGTTLSDQFGDTERPALPEDLTVETVTRALRLLDGLYFFDPERLAETLNTETVKDTGDVHRFADELVEWAKPDIKQLELAAVYTVAWGAEENVIDAWDAGTLRPDLFTDPGHQTIVEAVSGLIAAGEAPLHDVIHDVLTSDGRDLWDAARLHAVPGGRAALLAVMPDADDEHRYQALPHLLARLLAVAGSVVTI